VAEEWQTGGT